MGWAVFCRRPISNAETGHLALILEEANASLWARTELQMRFSVFVTTLCLVAAPSAVMAQSNPFLPPSAGGISRQQVEEIVRREVRSAVETSAVSQTPAMPGAPGAGVPSGMPVAPGATAGLPSQPGAALAQPNVTGGAMAPAEAPGDPVSDLLKDGGSFVGCVGATPIFKDAVGRRVYFTSKELRNSHEARRFARC